MSELPPNLAEQVVEDMRQRAEAAGTNLKDLLRNALETQTSYTEDGISGSN